MRRLFLLPVLCMLVISCRVPWIDTPQSIIEKKYEAIFSNDTAKIIGYQNKYYYSSLYKRKYSEILSLTLDDFAATKKLWNNCGSADKIKENNRYYINNFMIENKRYDRLDIRPVKKFGRYESYTVKAYYNDQPVDNRVVTLIKVNGQYLEIFDYTDAQKDWLLYDDMDRYQSIDAIVKDTLKLIVENEFSAYAYSRSSGDEIQSVRMIASDFSLKFFSRHLKGVEHAEIGAMDETPYTYIESYLIRLGQNSNIKARLRKIDSAEMEAIKSSGFASARRPDNRLNETINDYLRSIIKSGKIDNQCGAMSMSIGMMDDSSAFGIVKSDNGINQMNRLILTDSIESKFEDLYKDHAVDGDRSYCLEIIACGS